jgi:hypothetical protein
MNVDEAREYYRAYKEARVERYREYARIAASRSRAAFEASNRAIERIPLGQPILVGHHSERRHRADLKRCHNAMDRSCAEEKKARYWMARAESAENNTAISSRDPDALTLLLARIKVLEARQKRMKDVNTAHAKFIKNPASLDTLSLSDKDKEVIRAYVARYSWEPHPFPPYALQNNTANIRRLKTRLEDLARRRNTPAAPAHERIDPANNGWTVTIRENAEEDTISIEFPGKPCEMTRTRLKREFGFRWSGFDGAWKARRSNRSSYAISALFPDAAQE